MDSTRDEIAAHAARLVVDEGLDFGAAKRRAVRDLGLDSRTALPDNDQLDDAVREHLALFHGDTQPAELLALRELALTWMDRLADFRPHLTGAVWQGTATRLSDVHLQLFCDDPKSAEIALIDRGLSYEVGDARGPHGDTVPRLSLHVTCAGLGEEVGLHLALLDHDDLRGALRPDARGRSPRGDAAALRRLMTAEA